MGDNTLLRKCALTYLEVSTSRGQLSSDTTKSKNKKIPIHGDRDKANMVKDNRLLKLGG